jgi:hypothetical protein
MKTVAQRTDQTLALIDSQPQVFARQGAVVETWRTRGGRRFGPYFELRYREDGYQKRVYLGADGEAAQRVREHLTQRHEPTQQWRQYRQVRREILKSLRTWKAHFREQLRPLGLSIKGNEFRGWSQLRVNRGRAIPTTRVPRPSALSMIRQSTGRQQRRPVECWAAASTLVGWKPWALRLPDPGNLALSRLAAEGRQWANHREPPRPESTHIRSAEQENQEPQHPANDGKVEHHGKGHPRPACRSAGPVQHHADSQTHQMPHQQSGDNPNRRFFKPGAPISL